MKHISLAVAVAAILAACGQQAAPPAPAPADQAAPATAPAPPTASEAPPPASAPAEEAGETAEAEYSPPPPPSPQYVWTGGYWAWYGNWVWVHGRWAEPPRPQYHWVQPYYDHRGSHVVFVGGFWGAPGVSFVAPGLSVSLTLAVPGPGVVPGPPPMGPEGVFIPAPPGSAFGIIIPAPIGTSPAVVTGAPPVVNVGMRINSVVNNSNTTNITNTTNTTVINNTVINNVTIVAPASATASHQAVNVSVPASAHLAAAQPPVVRVMAPEPASKKPIPAFVPGHAVALPAPVTVRAVVPAELAHARPAAG